MLKSLPPHNKKPSKYPYESRTARSVGAVRAKSIDITHLEWTAPDVDIAKKIQSIDRQILEIGGPSDLGYYYLEDIILPSPVIISNIHMDTLKFAPNVDDLNAKTEILIDGRNIPTPDNSLGMVLSSHLSLIDEVGVDFETITDEDNAKFHEKIDLADAATKRVAETQTIDDEALKISLRLGIAHQVFQKLEPAGLYITDCTLNERDAFIVLGYKMLAYIDRNGIEDLENEDGSKQTPYFNVVLEKPLTTTQTT